MRISKHQWIIFFPLLVSGIVHAQSIRDRTRPNWTTEVTEAQAADLTLTLTEATVRQIQTWVRTAGIIDHTNRVLTAIVQSPDAELLRVGQRVRAFPPDSRSSVYQARVTRLIPQGNAVRVEATLSGPGRENSSRYVMEIITEQGLHLSVPNEAIIEEGDRRVVYVQQHPGHYVPQEIHTGVQGELYTVVLHGLEPGAQVVTVGSFFIDSEHKLKASDNSLPGNAHHNH